jgi:hypothetical protein
MLIYHLKRGFLLLILVIATFSGFGQSKVDSSRFYRGSVSATQNGLSFIPTFSLDRPAVLINIAAGRKRFSFEPDLRFGFDGKPWVFLFWWRYKLVDQKKFTLRIGTHPAVNFRTIETLSIPSADTSRHLEARRFLAGEIVPTWTITPNLKVGIFYMVSHGFDNSVRNTHFVQFNAFLPKLKMGKGYFMQATPSVFYLKQDALDGFYASSIFRLGKDHFPFALESITSAIIDSRIFPDRKFIWNVSIFYNFSHQYIKQHSGV